MSAITPIIMPKWGLSMSEGLVTSWSKQPGEAFSEGEDLVEIETSKIANVYEAPFSGRIGRIVAQEGETIPVGGLIAVAADETVSDADLDAFIAEFKSHFVPEDVEQVPDEGMAISTLTVGRRSLRAGVSGYLTAGAVPTVLVHGYSGDLNNWLFNLPALAARAPVIAVELPGHGASSKQLETGSLQELADAIAAVLQALDVDRCDLIGHSLGAAVAARLALDAPELARTLVLVAPAGIPGGAVNAAFLRGIANAQSIRELKPVLGLLFDDPALVTRDMADTLMKSKRLDGAEEALALIAENMIRGDDFRALADQLGNLSPVTVILGRSDKIVGPFDRTALPSGWQVAELEAGHMPHMERANEFNTLILETLP